MNTIIKARIKSYVRNADEDFIGCVLFIINSSKSEIRQITEYLHFVFFFE